MTKLYVALDDARDALDALAIRLVRASPVQRALALAEAKADLVDKVDQNAGDVVAFAAGVKADFATIMSRAPKAPG